KTMFESDLKGEWTYFYDENDKIIGRIAYQVLPNRSASLINLDHLLRGVYNYPEKETDQRVPWNVARENKEVNELNMNTSTLKDWMTVGNSPEVEAGLDVSTFELFFGGVGKDYVEGEFQERELVQALVCGWDHSGGAGIVPLSAQFRHGKFAECLLPPFQSRRDG
ncbi:MAG: hypothetical protein V8T86_05775, partial [Victivallis sp.]